MIEFTRALTRPIISIICAAVLAQVIVEQIAIPEYQWAVLTIPVLWWFVDRTVRRKNEKAMSRKQDKK